MTLIEPIKHAPLDGHILVNLSEVPTWTLQNPQEQFKKYIISPHFKQELQVRKKQEEYQHSALVHSMSSRKNKSTIFGNLTLCHGKIHHAINRQTIYFYGPFPMGFPPFFHIFPPLSPIGGLSKARRPPGDSSGTARARSNRAIGHLLGPV